MKKIAPKIPAKFLFSGHFQLVVLVGNRKDMTSWPLEDMDYMASTCSIQTLSWTHSGEGSLLGSGVRATLAFGNRDTLY